MSEPIPDTIAKPLPKLFIGFFAGLCAAFFPRLTAALAEQTNNLIFFPSDYIILGLVFAMLIGMVVMIIEWRVSAKPSATFMMALGIPALLTGALNAHVTTNTIKTFAQSQEELNNSLGKQFKIPESRGPVSPSINDRSSLQLEHDRFFFTLGEVSPVYAQVSTDPSALPGSQLSQLGIQIKERPYLVVIDRVKTKEGALEKARTLRPHLPEVNVVQSGQDYLVVQGGGPRTKSEALLEAIRLKNDYNLSPSILEVVP